MCQIPSVCLIDLHGLAMQYFDAEYLHLSANLWFQSPDQVPMICGVGPA